MSGYDKIWTDYYDLFSTGLEGDLRFYVEEAQRAGSPVLELGCGNGRILIPTAESGIEITGLDVSPHMLAELERRVERLDPEVRQRIELVRGDMSDFSLGRKFRLITIPYRAFLCMLTTDDQRRALSCIREHLTEDGRLILNFFDLKFDIAVRGLVPEPETRRLGEAVHPDTGCKVIRYSRCTHIPERQAIDDTVIFEELDAEGNVARRSQSVMNLRWIYRYEMQHLLELCGFEVEALYGDFDRGPFRYGGEQVWVARRSGRYSGMTLSDVIAG